MSVRYSGGSPKRSIFSMGFRGATAFILTLLESERYAVFDFERTFRFDAIRTDILLVGRVEFSTTLLFRSEKSKKT
jgi:hypothetical protein